MTGILASESPYQLPYISVMDSYRQNMQWSYTVALCYAKSQIKSMLQKELIAVCNGNI